MAARGRIAHNPNPRIRNSISYPFVREKLTRQKEPENAFDKYAVAMIKNGSVVGNLMKVESEKFAKKFFISSSRTN